MPVDMKTVPKNHLGALIAFAAAFILSLIGSYITVSSTSPDELDLGGAYEINGGVQNAWWSWATLGMLLLVVAAAIVAVRVFAPHVLPAGPPWQLFALAAAALGTLLIILRAVTSPDTDLGGGFSVNSGPGWSAYALFVAAIAQTVFTALGFRESGETAPWQARSPGGVHSTSPDTQATTGTTSTSTATSVPPPPVAGPTSSAPPAPPVPPPTTQPPSTPPPGSPPPT